MPVTVVDLFPTSKPSMYKSTTAIQGARQRLVFKLYDREGKPVDLTSKTLAEAGDMEAQPEEVAEFDDGQKPLANDNFVDLVYRVDVNKEQPTKIRGEILNQECATVAFTLNSDDLRLPGIYLGSIQVGTNDDYLFAQYPVYINVEPNIATPYNYVGVLTIPEVRMHLLDTDPSLNTLLDDYEFSDAEILNAMRKPVDYWNEALPPIAPYQHTTFPFRHNWLEGTCGYLLKSAAFKLRRNALDYSAAGLTIEDTPRAEFYLQLADKMLQEYFAWVSEKKMSINLGMGFGTIGGIGH